VPSISGVNWSFGARAKAGSVAYYQHTGRIISVNRNNIGSIIHELGHWIDFRAGRLSDRISFKTRTQYAESLPDMDQATYRYYTNRVEIFARAFEAYCLQKMPRFGAFAQGTGNYLPELNEELIQLIEEAINYQG
jgi:hypothetical protein